MHCCLLAASADVRVFTFVLQWWSAEHAGLLLIGPCVCVSVKMKVTQTASQRLRPLHPLHPSSLPFWQHFSLLPMTMRKMLGVAMSTRCCQTQMGPLLFTHFMCSLGSLRYICIFVIFYMRTFSEKLFCSSFFFIFVFRVSRGNLA